jgi:hypothetical protein
MRYRKLRKIILWCIGTIFVLSICSLFSANYAVNRVMDSFAAGLETDSGPDNQTLIESGEKPSAPSETAKALHENGVNSLGEPTRKATDQPTSQPTSNPTGTVTKAQAKKVRENLTVLDKATVVSVILKNLNLTDMKKLRDMANGGLTVEEKREAKQLLLAKLSSDDYNELSALAKKYGISRGKTYDEAKQEHQS